MHVGERRRRLRFAGRPIRDAAEWFRTEFPARPEDRDLVRAIVKCFAEDIGVEWTQFRSSDSFKDDLYLDAKFIAFDDLEVAWVMMEDVAQEFGLRCDRVNGSSETLGDLLRNWVRALHGNWDRAPNHDGASARAGTDADSTD